MRITLVRLLFSILIVRAIFLSPASGSDFGPGSHPARSSLKRHDAVRPSRLRFTKPCRPSTSEERVYACGGGDDRWAVVEPSADPRETLAPPRSTAPNRPDRPGNLPATVRLRC